MRKLLQIPTVPSGVTPTVYFVQLKLIDVWGKIVSSNFYWLSTKPPEFDWEKTVRSISTPVTSYEDISRLESLPKMHLTATARLRRAKDGEVCPGPIKELVSGAGIPSAPCGRSGEADRRDTAGALGR